MYKLINIDKLLNICNYIIWLFLGNLFFIILNIPMLLLLLLVSTNSIMNYKLLFFLCMLPVGPALTALLYVMSKLVQYKDVSIAKDFLKGYRMNFKVSIITCAIQSILFLVLYSNIEYFSKIASGYLFIPFFYVILVLLCLMTFYAYPLIAKFHIKALDVLKASIILTISKPLTTLINVAIIIFSIILMEIKESYAVLFIISITCYLIMFSQNKLFIDIEKNTLNTRYLPK